MIFDFIDEISLKMLNPMICVVFFLFNPIQNGELLVT